MRLTAGADGGRAGGEGAHEAPLLQVDAVNLGRGPHHQHLGGVRQVRQAAAAAGHTQLVVGAVTCVEGEGTIGAQEHDFRVVVGEDLWGVGWVEGWVVSCHDASAGVLFLRSADAITQCDSPAGASAHAVPGAPPAAARTAPAAPAAPAATAAAQLSLLLPPLRLLHLLHLLGGAGA